MNTEDFVIERVKEFDKISRRFAKQFSQDNYQYYISRHNFQIWYYEEIRPYSHNWSTPEPCVEVRRKYSGTFITTPISKIEIVNKIDFDNQTRHTSKIDESDETVLKYSDRSTVSLFGGARYIDTFERDCC